MGVIKGLISISERAAIEFFTIFLYEVNTKYTLPGLDNLTPFRSKLKEDLEYNWGVNVIWGLKESRFILMLSIGLKDPKL